MLFEFNIKGKQRIIILNFFKKNFVKKKGLLENLFRSRKIVLISKNKMSNMEMKKLTEKMKSSDTSNNNLESKKLNSPLHGSEIDMSILRKPLGLTKSTVCYKQQKSEGGAAKNITNIIANDDASSSRQISQSSLTNSFVKTKVKNRRANRRSTKNFLPEIELKKLPIASNRTPRERARLNSLTFNVVRDLSTFGICVIDNFIPKERGLYVLKEVCAISKSGLLQDGQLVSNPECKKNVKSIRSDKIAWVTGQENFASNIGSVISDVDYIVVGANRMPNSGKLGDYTINSRTKAMIACYPGLGTHYVKHVDNPNQDGRCITAIYYLNVNWSVEKFGGLLRIFPEGFRDQVANIEPIFNRLLIFWSDRRNPHEVQPSFRTRYAITLWYIDEAERNGAPHETKVLTKSSA